jgi:sugar lactone lactonase YvrE
MPSDVAIAPNGDIYIADMHHNRVRKVDAKTHTITTVAGTGVWGYSGDGGPALQARLAGPAGLAVVADAAQPGKVTIYIADFYNQRVRAVGPDGIIRDLTEDGRIAFGSPTRVAYGRGWLYVADSSTNRIIPLPLQKKTTPLRPLTLPAASRRTGG